MHLVDRTLRWQRGVLAATLVLAALGFTRATRDVFNTPKATVIVVGMIIVLAIGAVRLTRTRRVVVPTTWIWVAIGLFLVGLVIGVVASNHPMWSVVGRAGRHTGLAMYASYVILFALVMRLYRQHAPTVLVRTLVATAIPVAVYGLAQWVGVEPYDWNAIEGGPQVFATFGNANFYASWLGIITPLAAWAALSRLWSGRWRAASGLLWLVMLAAAFVAGSQQGYAVGLAGSALVALVYLWTTDEPVGRWRVHLTAAGAGLGVLALGGVAAGVGPLGGIRASLQDSFVSRLGKWQTALRMAEDRPFTGFGLNTFGDWFHAYRPQWVAIQDGLERTVDSPHNVPLEMLTSGGVVLAAGYLAVIGVTAWALVVGLRRHTGEQRLLLAGLGGAWLAYQLQSMVSIDIPVIAVLHWVLAGLVITIGIAPPLRQWALPGAPPLPAAKPSSSKRKKGKAKRQPVPLAPPSPVLTGLIVAAAVAATGVVSVPLAADWATQQGVRHAADGETRAAEARFEQAAALTPWEARPPQLHGRWMTRNDLNRAAYDAYREAIQRQPRGLSHALNLATVAGQLDRIEEAGRWYDRALEIDPKTPEVLARVGEYEASFGDPERATELLERALALDEGKADWWVALGKARSARGNTDAARRAYEQALDLDPNAEAASRALDQLALEAAGQ